MTQNEIIIPAFFAENGLTATSANHLSNIAKENYMAIERQMQAGVLQDGRRPYRWQRGDGCFVRNRSREVLPDREMGRGGMRMQEPDSVPARSYQGQGQAYEGFG